MDSAQKELSRKELHNNIRMARLNEAALIHVQSYDNQVSVRFKCASFQFEKGCLINSTDIHLLIYFPGSQEFIGTYSVFLLKDNRWNRLLDVDSDYTTQGVTFKDINGDRQKDFLLEGYMAAGSGEKYYNRAYIYDSINQNFNFIEDLGLNPHFYPEKDIVTCYYQPSMAWSAQKYKLNWNVLELIEEVEIELQGFVESTGNLEGNRKIYRYRDGKKIMYKNDRVCSFPREYKPYRELVKTLR